LLSSVFLVVNQISSSQNNTLAGIFNSNKDSKSNTGNQKSQPQYTEIFFPSTKLIIQITSKLTRAPVLGIVAHREIQKTLDSTCKP
jgi:hypothetical protein